jgi:hypothetical protein
MNGKRLALLVLVLAMGVSTASAEVIFVSKGWQITMPDWAGSTSGASVTEDPVIAPNPDEILLVEIFKVFKGSPDPFSMTDPLVMNFQQIEPDAASKIVINDESVTNFDTLEWTGFEFSLGDPDDVVEFNEAQTFPGGGNDFYLDQFTTAVFGTNGDGNESLLLSGGVVSVGDDFTPGSLSGALVIDADTSGGQASFDLIEMAETGEIPEPMTLSILAAGGVGLLIRRKR